MFNLFEHRSRVVVTSPLESGVVLVEKGTNIKLTPYNKILDKLIKTTYSNIWNGLFIVEINNKNETHKLEINTNKPDVIKDKEYQISIETYSKFKKIRPGKFQRKISHFFLKKGWGYTLNKADHIITVCDYLKNIALNKTKRDNIETIPIGIDKKDFPTKTKKLNLLPPSVVIIQNHQIEDKSKALVSFSQVIEKLPEITFYISKGFKENQNNTNAKNVFDTLGKQKNVRFVEIDKSNKYDYLSNANLYILRSGLDCTPATILEAGLAGKPVIASKVGGVPEMIDSGRTGWVISNEQTDTWINKIKELIKDKKLSLKMGEQHKKNVLSKYEIRIIAEKLYRSL